MILKNGKRIDGCTDTLPVGTVQPFLGLTPPLGYLVCQGQLISKVEYPELYNICKSTFGVETETHFYLPDLRGKTIAGYDSSDTAMNTLGKLLGNKTHTHTSAAHTHTVAGHTHTSAAHVHSTGNHTLTIAEMPSHTHTLYQWTNWGSKTAVAGYYTPTSPSGGALCVPQDVVTDGNNPYYMENEYTGGSGAHNHGNTGSTTPGATGSTSLTTNSTTPGATGSNSNFQPTIVMNWIVKAAMLIPEYFIVENTLTSTSTSNALSAAQGKILNDKIENYGSFRTTETIVGYADNNVPVYRKLIEITTPSEVGVDTVVGTLPADQKGLYTMQGIVVNGIGCGVPFNYYFGAENWGSIWFDYSTKEIWCVINNQAYASRQGHIIIEYSKH